MSTHIVVDHIINIATPIPTDISTAMSFAHKLKYNTNEVLRVFENKTLDITQKTNVDRIKSLDHNPIHKSKYLHMDIGSITQHFLRIATCIFLMT